MKALPFLIGLILIALSDLSAQDLLFGSNTTASAKGLSTTDHASLSERQHSGRQRNE